MNPQEFKNALSNFSGTMQWHRWTPLAPNYLLTDGALFVAEEGGGNRMSDNPTPTRNQYRAELAAAEARRETITRRKANQ